MGYNGNVVVAFFIEPKKACSKYIRGNVAMSVVMVLNQQAQK